MLTVRDDHVYSLVYSFIDSEGDITMEEKRREKQHLTEEQRARRRALRRKQRRRRVIRNRIILGCVLALIVILIITGIVRTIRKHSTASSAGEGLGTVSQSAELSQTDGQAKAEALAAETADKIEPTDIKLSFTGDFILGTDEYFDYSTSMNAYYDIYGADYFMQNIKPVFEQDDLTIINFEGTLTEETTRADKTFAFKAPPEYIDIINDASIEGANVANNHSKDYGEQSFTDTIETLEANNIKHFGYEDTATFEVNGVKLGFFGIYELDEYDGVAPQITARIQELQEQECDIIVAVFHWGNELESYPDQYQVELGHQAIDEGADLVIGHHPHVLQGIEYYKGKTIAYSLGNFCFGGNSHPTEMDTMVFQMTFSVNENAEITDQQINIIPCLVSTTWEYNDYVPTILTGTDADDVIAKLDTRSQEIALNYDTDTVYDSSTDGTVGFTTSDSTESGTSEAGSSSDTDEAESLQAEAITSSEV